MALIDNQSHISSPEMDDRRPIRVLIVEDSAPMRDLLVSILQDAAGVQVVGMARNGLEAVQLTQQLEPDIVTMDVHMPQMDGYEAIRHIMAELPRPIVVISNEVARNEAQVAFDALQAGALSILNKPSIADPPEVHQALVHQIKLMAEVKVVRHWSPFKTKIDRLPAAATPPPIVDDPELSPQVVAIASSTGGPGALATIFSQLPANFTVPILVVQHISPGFGIGLANWLNRQTPLAVRVASVGDRPEAGQILIAPDSYHMVLNEQSRISFRLAGSEDQLCPSADTFFHSIARVYGPRAIGLILTGMGRDGADGLAAMRDQGASTIAQDKESCVVFGMPAAAIELDAAGQVLPLANIAQTILGLLDQGCAI